MTTPGEMTPEEARVLGQIGAQERLQRGAEGRPSDDEGDVSAVPGAGPSD